MDTESWLDVSLRNLQLQLVAVALGCMLGGTKWTVSNLFYTNKQKSPLTWRFDTLGRLNLDYNSLLISPEGLLVDGCGYRVKISCKYQWEI